MGYPVGSGPPVGYPVGSGPPVGYSVGPGKRQEMHAVQLENAGKLIRPYNINSFSRDRLIAVLRFIIVFIWKLFKGRPFFMLFFCLSLKVSAGSSLNRQEIKKALTLLAPYVLEVSL